MGLGCLCRLSKLGTVGGLLLEADIDGEAVETTDSFCYKVCFHAVHLLCVLAVAPAFYWATMWYAVVYFIMRF